MSPRARYWLHMAAFMVVDAIVLFGGIVLIGHFTAGAGLGIALVGVGLWGWFVGGMAMAYWDAKLREMPARGRPRPRLDPLILDDYLDAPNRTIRHEEESR